MQRLSAIRVISAFRTTSEAVALAAEELIPIVVPAEWAGQVFECKKKKKEEVTSGKCGCLYRLKHEKTPGACSFLLPKVSKGEQRNGGSDARGLRTREHRHANASCGECICVAIIQATLRDAAASN